MKQQMDQEVASDEKGDTRVPSFSQSDEAAEIDQVEDLYSLLANPRSSARRADRQPWVASGARRVASAGKGEE